MREGGFEKEEIGSCAIEEDGACRKTSIVWRKGRELMSQKWKTLIMKVVKVPGNGGEDEREERVMNF